MIRRQLPSRLMPLASSHGVRPLYGDIHNHCDLSYGHGRFEDALARAALQLDFVSITGHAHWPDMPIDDPRVAHIVAFHVDGFAKLRRNWDSHFTALAAANTPDLTVFPGYEIHSNAYGDYTILYRDIERAPLLLADSPAGLKARLRDAFGNGAFAFPHHIGYRQGARGINWSAFDPELSPFVEIFSMHGCAETSETERGYLHSMGPADCQGTMRYGLRAGQQFGIVANTDHHSAFPGSYGHGRTAVYAAENDRNLIWQALRGRRSNALTGDNIHLLTAIGDVIQGGTVQPQTNASLQIEAIGGGFIDTIDVIHNGRLAHRISPMLTPAPISMDFETILYVEFGWGARGKRHDWDCQLWVDGGTIDTIEPRFRGAEIVSPLEGRDPRTVLPFVAFDGRKLSLKVTAEANPNNVTPATQGVAMRATLTPQAVIKAEFCGQPISIPASRLLEGAKSGNLGPIDSPAWRFHTLPRPRDWQWRGRIDIGALSKGDSVYVRLKQAGGQTAWTSPIFCD